MRCKCINFICGCKSVTGSEFGDIDFLNVWTVLPFDAAFVYIGDFHCACAVSTIVTTSSLKSDIMFDFSAPIFYRATACRPNATHGIAVATLSVCQMRVLWQNEIIVCQYLNTIRNTNISSSLSTPPVVAGNCPLPPEIFADSDPPLPTTPTSTDFRL